MSQNIAASDVIILELSGRDYLDIQELILTRQYNRERARLKAVANSKNKAPPKSNAREPELKVLEHHRANTSDGADMPKDCPKCKPDRQCKRCYVASRMTPLSSNSDTSE